ncbi:FAD-dependent oxidoreductase [Streptomyces sp. HB-N217]|uniref:FAD-binding oxidoreductase n=2 Tax=unclassified Streptomyces TaxID=2593676 RepID=UPI0018DA3403|nr:FAD-dependent oxidoreductase [Streptomyces sp. HB-N217]MBH5134801.1 FAD-dependent oxidoreductase [Streptomyces sp. HB-N217]
MTVLPESVTGPHGSTDAALRAVLADAARVVGADRVTHPGEEPDGAPVTPLGPNVSLYRSRTVHGVVRPQSADEVRRLVALFADGSTGARLHAFSTGGNWGLGSREPAADGAVVLDLSGLDQIRDIDVAQGWAVVEPGVTQARLATLLAGTERMLNVTVSSAHTSVVGNALDRGVGLRHQRVDDLMGLEVVLPDGETVRVGWWPEALRVVRLNFAPRDVEAATAEIRRWVAQGLARGVVKIYNEAAAAAYGGPAGQYLVHVCVDGTRESVAALTGVVTAEAERSGLFSAVSATDAEDPEADNHDVAVRVERAYAGDPDPSDALFEAKMGRPAVRLDEEGGFLFFLPLVPFTGAALARADALLEQVRVETGVRCGATLNALGADVVDCVVTMKFPRGGEEADNAHLALDRLYELFATEGFIPYRLDIEHTDWADRLAPDTGARAFARRLKDAVDPHRVIAPGRYA